MVKSILYEGTYRHHHHHHSRQLIHSASTTEAWAAGATLSHAKIAKSIVKAACFITDRVSEKSNKVGRSVRPFVSILSF